MAKTNEPKGVKITVNLTFADYVRLEALKTRRKVRGSGSASGQQIITEWIRQGLDAAEQEEREAGKRGGSRRRRDVEYHIDLHTASPLCEGEGQ